MSQANGARDAQTNGKAPRDGASRGGGASDQLREDLRALVAEIAEKDEIPDSSTFKELGIDSMMGVEIVAAIERQYLIKIEDDELASFKDLDAAYALVVRKLEAKAGTAAAE
jgi:acyl carrier protein